MKIFCLILFILKLSYCKKTEDICEKSVFRPKCYGNEVLQILNATYGRLDNTTCHYDNSSIINTINCSSSVLDGVRTQCDNKTSCWIDTISFTPDPCVGTSKYLTVTWDCIPYDYKNTRRFDHMKNNTGWLGICDVGIIQINYAMVDDNSDDVNDTCQLNVTSSVAKQCDGKLACSVYEYYNTLELFGIVFPCNATEFAITVDWECQPFPTSLQPIPLPGSLSCSACINFVLLGDYGGQPIPPYTTPTQIAVATGLGDIGLQIKSQFVVTLGDNFYSLGVNTSDDFRFNNTWDSVYIAPSLQTKWYIIAGNHDWYGNVQALVQHTQKAQSAYGKNWYFPALVYDEVWPIPGSNRTVHAIFFDTYHLTTEDHRTERDPNWSNYCVAWLNFTLANSYSHWKIIFSHYPFLSLGKHGRNNDIETLLQPMFEKYKVDLYMTGHDHNSQHITFPGVSWPVNHFVMGGADDIIALSPAHIASMDPSYVHFAYPPSSETKTTITCGSGAFIASCSTLDGQIFINSAILGRQDNTTACSSPSRNFSCVVSIDVTVSLQGMCNDLNTCIVPVINGSTFGVEDPCPGSSYLNVGYTCTYTLGSFGTATISADNVIVSFYSETSRLQYQTVISKNVSMELPPFPPETFIPPFMPTTPVLPTPTTSPSSTAIPSGLVIAIGFCVYFLNL